MDYFLCALNGIVSVGERELDWVDNEQAGPTKLDNHGGEGGLRLKLVRAAPVGKELRGESTCQGVIPILFSFVLFNIPSVIFVLFLSRSPSLDATQIHPSGVTRQALLPPPHYGTCGHQYYCSPNPMPTLL